jgi:hypothetical protein
MRIAEPRHLAASARQGKAAKAGARRKRWKFRVIARPAAASQPRGVLHREGEV